MECYQILRPLGGGLHVITQTEERKRKMEKPEVNMVIVVIMRGCDRVINTV